MILRTASLARARGYKQAIRVAGELVTYLMSYMDLPTFTFSVDNFSFFGLPSLVKCFRNSSAFSFNTKIHRKYIRSNFYFSFWLWFFLLWCVCILWMKQSYSPLFTLLYQYNMWMVVQLSHLT